MIKTLHIGVGGRGMWAVDLVSKDRRFEAAAVVDVMESNLAPAGEKLPEAKRYTDVAKALAEVKADAAIICTPTRTHAPLARQCFAAGLHVLVEKGMALNYAEAKALTADSHAAGRKLAVAQNYRYRANERLITTLISDPAHPKYVGKPYLVDYVHHRHRPEPRTLDYPYAMVWDMACHHVDSLSCWLGPVDRVTAVSSRPPWAKYTHDCDIRAVLEYKGGAVCHYLLTHGATYGEWRILLQGEKGAVLTGEGPVSHFAVPGGQLWTSPATPVEVPPAPQSEQGVLNDFHDWLTLGQEPGISADNNLHTLAVCELLVRSATERRTVSASEL